MKLGFLEYAQSMFFQKNGLKTCLSVSSEVEYPQLYYEEDGLTAILPEPAGGEESVSLMGYTFPASDEGRFQVVSLFRAASLHLSTHSITGNYRHFDEWKKDKDPNLAEFAISLTEDTIAGVHISQKHPEWHTDTALANALALGRMRRADMLINPATRIMTSLLIRVSTGQTIVRSEGEIERIARLCRALDRLKDDRSTSLNGKSFTEGVRTADEIYSIIEDSGPVTEAPFLPHTEQLGRCSILSPPYFVDFDVTREAEFSNCLAFLEGSSDQPKSPAYVERWRKTTEVETAQVLNSWEHEGAKNKKTLSKYRDLLASTRFESVAVPEPAYSRFLKHKAACKSEAHRLIESLLVARDAIDEDPRKMYGVLDLAEVIQVVASKSPRMDVFMLDENISKSYAWVILLDASQSMSPVGDFALELFVMAAEAANQLLLDPSSWGMYAFNERFLVIKDPKERYNVRVRSRIGGVKFEGATYMPDALRIAGQILKSRNENLRLITVFSDGWPFGYDNIESELSETIEFLEKANIAVIGIGVKSRRMQDYFGKHSNVYTLRDLKKKFSTLYLEASRIAVES